MLKLMSGVFFATLVACATPSFAATPLTYDGTCPSGKKCVIVARGDYIIKIAKNNDVAWEALMLANETELVRLHDARCGLLRARYRRSSTRRGHYCNDRRHRAWANSLKPGDVLVLPPKGAPKTISAAVAKIPGHRVAIVIDDTGSMNDDRRVVAQLYTAALRQQGKIVVGVWLYGDGKVRKIVQAGSSLPMRLSGNLENTHQALNVAARARPDAIVLITDERGDDWRWADVGRLPPVIAHCLFEGDGGCKGSLSRLATATRGTYVKRQ